MNAILVLLAVGFLSSCASTRQYAPRVDQPRKIDDPEKARIYVIRPAVFFGGLIPMKVSMGKPLSDVQGRGDACHGNGNPDRR